MKFWKHTFIAAAAFVGISTTVLYTSCEKDACLELKCLNGGACTDGFCRCPSEYEGPTCGERIVDKFLGAYYGQTRCIHDTTEFPAIIDTVEVFLKDSVTLTVVQHSRISDTFYGKAGTKDTEIGVTASFITIPDDSFSTSAIRKVTVKLDEGKKRLTVYTQNIVSTNPLDKTDCDFLGFKK